MPWIGARAARVVARDSKCLGLLPFFFFFHYGLETVRRRSPNQGTLLCAGEEGSEVGNPRSSSSPASTCSCAWSQQVLRAFSGSSNIAWKLYRGSLGHVVTTKLVQGDLNIVRQLTSRIAAPCRETSLVRQRKADFKAADAPRYSSYCW